VGIHISQIDLLIGPRALLWHARMMRACERAGFATSTVAGADHGEKIIGLDLLLAFERLVYRVRDCALQPTHIDVKPTIGADLIIDLSGATVTRASAGNGAILLRPLFNGSPDPAAAVSALLDRRAPRLSVELQDAEGSRIVAGGPSPSRIVASCRAGWTKLSPA
jgi:hypothetical protein